MKKALKIKIEKICKDHNIDKSDFFEWFRLFDHSRTDWQSDAEVCRTIEFVIENDQEQIADAIADIKENQQ